MATIMTVGIIFPQPQIQLGSVLGGDVRGLMEIVLCLSDGEAELLFCDVVAVVDVQGWTMV
jgi:hypothetical protein